ncbi:MAG: ribbon-helix-helix domain-containing protein [Halanaerobiales bacterium]
MKVITTHITKEQEKFLSKKSEKTGVPKAEIIRRAINEYIERREQND